MSANNNKAIYVLATVIGLAVLGVATGMVNLGSFNVSTGANSGGGGLQTPPQTTTPIGGTGFTGQLTMTVTHRDALDPTESRTETTNISTLYFKSTDGGKTFSSLGSGTAVTINIDSAMDSILYIATPVTSGQAFFIAPMATSDKNLNPRIIDFGFKDVTGDGQSEWWFKLDLHNMPPPIAGQTASNLTFYVQSYDEDTPVTSMLSAPSSILSISTTAGTDTWIRWEKTVAAEKAQADYEYEVKFNSTTTTLWDRGDTILSIPNLGDKSLSDFVESQDGTSTFYKLTLGGKIDTANYVTTPTNGNTVKTIPLKVSTNFAASGSSGDGLSITLTVRTMTAAQGTGSDADTIKVCSAVCT